MNSVSCLLRVSVPLWLVLSVGVPMPTDAKTRLTDYANCAG